MSKKHCRVVELPTSFRVRNAEGASEDEGMSDSTTGSEGRKPVRGEAAWKAAKDSVAARNAEVRKAAKRQREAKDVVAAHERADAHRREMAALSKSSGER